MGNSNYGTTCMRVRGDDGELRPWHYIYVCSIERRLMMIYPHFPQLARCMLRRNPMAPYEDIYRPIYTPDLTSTAPHTPPILHLPPRIYD